MHDFKRLREIIYGSRGFRIRVPISSCTLAAGAENVYNAVVEALKTLGVDAEIHRVGCMGACYLDPWIELAKEGLPPAIYANVKAEAVEDLISRYVDGDLGGALAIRFRVDGFVNVPTLDSLPAWRHQVRFVSRNCGLVDPESIDDYIATGGYSGLKKALSLS
ncbi:MAG: hypothetical protein QXS42_06655, partial [Zestosphaera sp.]